MGDNYQEALEIMCHRCVNHEACQGTGCTPKKDIKKLVDKATPRNPTLSKTWEDEDTKTIYDEYGRINELLCVCPNCGESAVYDYEYNKRFKYCSNCGQRIDWSDEDGK